MLKARCAKCSWEVSAGADFRFPPWCGHCGGDLKIGDKYVYQNGRIAMADHPKVRAIAEKHKDRPGLEPEKWLQTPR